MGKGKKTNVVAAIQQGNRAGESTADSKKGCNCPIGCVVGESIPAGAHKLPDGAVKTICSNENCPAVPYQHAACYEKWEEFLADGVKRQQGCYRQMTKAAIQRELWDRRMAPMIVKLSTCPACHGHIRRAVQDERAEQVWRQAAQVARNPQPVAAALRNNNNRNRVPPAAAAAAPPLQPAKRQPALNKASMRVNPAGRPKAVVSNEVPLRRPVTSMYASAWPQPMSHDESYYAPSRLPPVGAERWQEARQPQEKKSPTRVDTNDLHEFPTLRDDVWDPVPQAMAAELRAAQAVSSSWSTQNQHSATMPVPAFDPNNLTSAQLISELEDAVKAFSELWTSHEVVRDLLDRLDVRVMEEIANFGGLEQWLSSNSSTLVIRKNRIVLKSDSVPAQLKSFGNVTRILSSAGDTGIVYAEAYDVKVFFDVADCTFDGGTTYFEGDIVSFKAEKVVESAWHGCKWQAVFLELIQREERAAASARAKQTGHAQRYWSSTATAVESPIDMKDRDSYSESSSSIGKSGGASVPFDIESIIARTPYLQIHPVTNTKNIRLPTPVGGFRRIPMATVTPDDFHPSTTASSSPGPLQRSSPLLPDMDDLPATCGKVESDSSSRHNCETPLSFDAEKSRKTAASMTESVSSFDELTVSVAGDFNLDAWLSLDKSVEDGLDYAACSKEIKELIRQFS